MNFYASKQNAKVLIVEDDPAIGEGLVDNLKTEGYQVQLAHNGEEGLHVSLDWGPDLILLDVMLPNMSGYEVLQALRKRNFSGPILMVTAKGEEFDRCLGLDLGADDYIVKPFSLKELLARVKAQLRRVQLFQGAGKVLHFGIVEVDFNKRTLKRNGEQEHITATELAVLKYLADRKGQVLSRQQIIDEVWGYDYFGTERTVDNFIRMLRVKIEPDPNQPQYLLTKRGMGYVFKL